MTSVHLAHIKEFEDNQNWLQKHSNSLLKKYKNSFIAVWNNRVIANDTELKTLSKKVHKEYKGCKGVVIEYISDEPIEMIL